MENQENHKMKSEDLNPVSRKTSEEIDQDENGNLIIDGKQDLQSESSPNRPGVADQHEHLED
jgi:hypothetical protein